MANVSFKGEGEINTAPDKRNLKAFAADTAALQRALGGPADTDLDPSWEAHVPPFPGPAAAMETTDYRKQPEDGVNTRSDNPGWCDSMV